MIWVTKADGSKQVFEKTKVIRTCLKLGANKREARIVADKIEKEIYDGIETKKILKLIFKYLQEFKPELKYQISLRESVCLLNPKPDFELFCSRLLEELGYRVKLNQIVRGKCVEHEVDGIAKKGKEVVLVEVKHHVNPHVFTGLEVFLKTYAIYLDLREGFRIGKTKEKFNRVMLICSTKISDHAIKYAKCNNITYLAWKVPIGNSLEDLIDRKKLYPITFLKGLELEEQNKLVSNNLILLKDLVVADLEKLQKTTGLSLRRLRNLQTHAKKILSI